MKKIFATKETGIFLLLIVLCVLGQVFNHQFLSPVNLSNLFNQVGMYGIFSIGMGLVIITGGIDLSVGSVMALQGVLLGMMLSDKHWPWFVAIPLSILLCVMLGLFNGFLITKVRLQPFIVTLCGLLFYRGVARFVTDDQTKGFGDAVGFEGIQNFLTGKIGFFSIDNGKILTKGFGVVPPGDTVGLSAPYTLPVSFLLLLVIAGMMWTLLHRSVYGRYLFAVGRNEDAARYSGINTRAVISSAYVLLGFLTAISGILFAFYTNSVQPSGHAQSYELYGVAAAVLGGCSLRGGEGSILGIIFGTILLIVLQNLVNLLGIPSSLNFAVMGAVILLGVLADGLLKNRKPRAVSVASEPTTPAPVSGASASS
ncbi:monosaccharide ABC transporter membrane protein, CUT2 family [Abditibacterium utsteinense]|uniref:Monosaccharide ABC transporter membrane protein, CUT2 family n=1 Tax=Abditibacterium utsteinense TaxID=1960156 RepID=A0A2S8SSJ8_9BACT|nr:ABC transporter permease [Abditibacterium utsteinense]PQV63709.1 monosaccharide ABC transporter membrane protein, CUT2 family [Abditibacterium utsteinense]